MLGSYDWEYVFSGIVVLKLVLLRCFQEKILQMYNHSKWVKSRRDDILLTVGEA